MTITSGLKEYARVTFSAIMKLILRFDGVCSGDDFSMGVDVNEMTWITLP